MKLIGLTGAIGSGKSSVSALFARKGAIIIDGDGIAKQLQQKGSPTLQKLVDEFGDILLESGELDRAKVAQMVFGDADMLKRLNAIMHPAIGVEILRQIELNMATDNVVVLDMPLLVENQRDGMSGLVVVDVEPEVAISRLVQFRNMNEEDARRRMANQASREDRLKVADRVIDNSGKPEDLTAQVDDVWDWFATLPNAQQGAGTLTQKSK
ncbi:MAG: dephospho-CoA kinase [Actinomycetota bacterium]